MSKFRNENEITKEEFIEVCKNSKTKQEAYTTLNMHRNTFEKYLIKYEYEFPKVKHSPKKLTYKIFLMANIRTIMRLIYIKD